MSPVEIDAPHWRAYLFEVHSEETLRAWARRLQLFRFCRAYGGHANDGDSLLVAYAYRSESELRGFFDAFGLSLVAHSAAPPQAEPNVSYSLEEYRKFPSLIPRTTWLQQPGHCQIAQQAVFAWCSGEQIQLSISHGYDVTEADVQRAEHVEQALRDVGLPRVEPPLPSRHCVCPAFYPALFA